MISGSYILERLGKSLEKVIMGFEPPVTGHDNSEFPGE